MDNHLSGVVDFVEYVGYIVKLRVKFDWRGEVILKKTQDVYFQKPCRAEWDYWYEGKPARTTIVAPDGTPIAQPGEVRDGGSYMRRMGNIYT